MGEVDARDRAIGALVGLACGDAVGTTVEFAPPGSFPPVTDMVGGGPFGLPVGAWTDDTSMALCLGESILERGGLDLADNLTRYLRWYRDGHWSSTGTCFDIGTTTRAALVRFERTGATSDAVVDQDAAANGSLMRLAPVPTAWWRSLDDAVARSGESSRATHAAARPVDACRAMGAVVAALIAGEPWEVVSAPGFWRWGELHPEVAEIVAGSFRAKEPPEIRGSGYCVDALEAAMWAVDGASTFREAVLRAVNLGDDADTTGAIAGQVAGARWGVSAIPPTWVEHLVKGAEIRSMAGRLFDLHAPPSPSPPPSALPLPPSPLSRTRHEMLQQRERSVPSSGGSGGPGVGVGAQRPSWPDDAEVHAWWVAPGALLAGEYPTDIRGTARKVELLAAAGIRTWVDLTTPMDGLDPYDRLIEEEGIVREVEMRRVSFPIPDMSVVDPEGYVPIVERIDAEIAEGRPVYVHCWGGIGRTGTVIGCWLISKGVPAAEVVDVIADLRTGTRKVGRPSPETRRQQELLRSWVWPGA